MSRQQECEDWGIPYYGPTIEECNEDDDRGDFLYHMSKESEDDECNAA